jgi:hypothetical protein
MKKMSLQLGLFKILSLSILFLSVIEVCGQPPFDRKYGYYASSTDPLARDYVTCQSNNVPAGYISVCASDNIPGGWQLMGQRFSPTGINVPLSPGNYGKLIYLTPN